MRILVTTDFSAESREACRIAVEMARAMSGTLVVATVIESLRHDVAPTSPGDPVAARLALDGLCADLATHGLDLRADVLIGSFDGALRSYVKAHAVDLVILHDRSRDDEATLAQGLGCPAMVLGDESGGMRAAFAGAHRLRVFVAVDRTEASDAPIAWLRRLRTSIPCDVTLLYAYWPATEHDRLGVPLDADLLTANPTVTAALELEIRRRVGELGGEGTLTIRCRPTLTLIDEVVATAARRRTADLVVVGSHNRKGWDAFSHPSVSQALLSESHLPVVCVSHGLFSYDAHPPLRRVLAATDLSPAGNHAIRAAYDLVGDNIANVAIVHVRSSSSPSLTDRDLTERLHGLIPPGADSVTTEIAVLERGPIAETILQKAAQWNADTICLGAQSHGILGRSVAAEIVKHADCRVLVSRSRAS